MLYNYFNKGEAKGGGDCLFDAIAQALRLVMPKIEFSAKSVRGDCAKYVQDLLDAGKDLPNWIMRSFGHPRDDNGQTISTAGEYQNIQFSVEEFPRKEIPRPIWGLSEVEARILCEIYDVTLHLVEMHVIDGKCICVDVFINRSSNKNTIHIINQGASHFEPLFEKYPGAYRDYLTAQGLSPDS